MNRRLRVFARGLGIFVVLFVVAVASYAAYVAIRGIPSYAPGNVQLKVEPTPDRLARGEKRGAANSLPRAWFCCIMSHGTAPVCL